MPSTSCTLRVNSLQADHLNKGEHRGTVSQWWLEIFTEGGGAVGDRQRNWDDLCFMTILCRFVSCDSNTPPRINMESKHAPLEKETHLQTTNVWVPSVFHLQMFLLPRALACEMIQFEEHIFQMEWNHQLDVFHVIQLWDSALGAIDSADPSACSFTWKNYSMVTPMAI